MRSSRARQRSMSANGVIPVKSVYWLTTMIQPGSPASSSWWTHEIKLPGREPLLTIVWWLAQRQPPSAWAACLQFSIEIRPTLPKEPSLLQCVARAIKRRICETRNVRAPLTRWRTMTTTQRQTSITTTCSSSKTSQRWKRTSRRRLHSLSGATRISQVVSSSTHQSVEFEENYS